MTKTERKQHQIQKQYSALERLRDAIRFDAGNRTDGDFASNGKSIYSQLLRLEGRGGRLAEAMCNRPVTQDEIDRNENAIRNGVIRALGGIPKGFFINKDPRGYCLKIDDLGKHYPTIQIHTDFGGYGILAPEITGE